MGNTNAKAKSIQLLLYDGTLNGVINIADSSWSPGEMYAAPRESVADLFSQGNTNNFGVYLLLSDTKVYVGQAQDLERRIKQHINGKDWWEKVVLLTTQDDSFTRTDIDYLESVLISKAEVACSLDSDNKNKGNNPKVDKFRKVILDQYLDEALFLMELIGVTVFRKQNKRSSNSRKKTPVITISTPNVDSTDESKENRDIAVDDAPLTPDYIKPELPDINLGPCAFAKTAVINLLKSGYLFSDEQMLLFGSVEGSRQYTMRNLPMFWILKDGESRSTCEKNVRSRYWKDEFSCGKYRFLLYSQWYENQKKGATKDNFIAWYNEL